MARKKRLLQITSSSAILPIAEPGDEGRVTRSRSRANAADVHTETCSLSDNVKPRKRVRGEAAAAAVAASSSTNAEGTEEGLDGDHSFGRGDAAAAAVAASPSPNAEGTEDGIDGQQSYARGEAASAAVPASPSPDTEEGLDSEQSYGPSEEEAGGDGDHNAIVVVDDPSDHNVVVIADDHDDPNGTSITSGGGNNSNRCGSEDNISTPLTGSAASQESLETIQTTWNPARWRTADCFHKKSSSNVLFCRTASPLLSEIVSVFWSSLLIAGYGNDHAYAIQSTPLRFL